MPQGEHDTSRNNEPWTLEWTPERIERFWNWYATQPDLVAGYFSGKVGHSILREIRRNVSLRGLVVDLGSGPGFMVDRLLEQRIRTVAIDSSRKSVEALNKRLGGREGFAGAIWSDGRIPLDDGVADTVLLLETIEHLDKSVFASMLQDIRRVLRPGGHIVVTTPHNENLAESEVLCPNCGCVFHRMQHLRSFDVGSLNRAMTEAGFQTALCKATYFSLLRGLHASLERVRRRIERLPNPHLLYIGRKDG
jgi:SAM-dependent methyltransferase